MENYILVILVALLTMDIVSIFKIRGLGCLILFTFIFTSIYSFIYACTYIINNIPLPFIPIYLLIGLNYSFYAIIKEYYITREWDKMKSMVSLSLILIWPYALYTYVRPYNG